MASKLLTTQQAAAVIGYSDSRLRQLIGAGIAKPMQRIGHSWVFSQAEVKRLQALRPGKQLESEIERRLAHPERHL